MSKNKKQIPPQQYQLELINGELLPTAVKAKRPTPGWHIRSGLTDIPQDDVEMRMAAVYAYAAKKFQELAKQGQYPATVPVTDSNGITHHISGADIAAAGVTRN